MTRAEADRLARRIAVVVPAHLVHVRGRVHAQAFNVLRGLPARPAPPDPIPDGDLHNAFEAHP